MSDLLRGGAVRALSRPLPQPHVCPQPSERMRVEILSLSLAPEGWVALDQAVARLFVEYSLLDLPTEETPLSLPKPPRGKSINYNYSKGGLYRSSPGLFWDVCGAGGWFCGLRQNLWSLHSRSCGR